MVNLCKKCSKNIGNQCFAHDKPEPLPLGSCFRCDCFEHDTPKVAKWEYEDSTIKCSLCGCTLIKANHQYPYCPDCGAEMIYEVL